MMLFGIICGAVFGCFKLFKQIDKDYPDNVICHSHGLRGIR